MQAPQRGRTPLNDQYGRRQIPGPELSATVTEGVGGGGGEGSNGEGVTEGREARIGRIVGKERRENGGEGRGGGGEGRGGEGRGGRGGRGGEGSESKRRVITTALHNINTSNTVELKLDKRGNWKLMFPSQRLSHQETCDADGQLLTLNWEESYCQPLRGREPHQEVPL